MPNTRHEPSRTCAACHSKRAKGGLVRIVRTPYGEVKVDITGKLNGRGAYFCPDSKCWEHGLSQRRLSKLEYALRGRIGSEDRQKLIEHISSLPKVLRELQKTS